MCGITVFLFTRHQKNDLSKHIECILKSLQTRGPDSIGYEVIVIDEEYTLLLVGSTLHIRGQSVIRQPLKDSRGNVLQWNGEIFAGFSIADFENDGEVLLERLSNCKQSEEVLNLISSIKGPYAFVYWQNNVKKLWFGRDLFGRRSLVVAGQTLKKGNIYSNSDNNTTSGINNKNYDGDFLAEKSNEINSDCENLRADTTPIPFPLIISSVTFPLLEHNWKELAAFGIYCFDFNVKCHKNSLTPFFPNPLSLTSPSPTSSSSSSSSSAFLVTLHPWIWKNAKKETIKHSRDVVPNLDDCFSLDPLNLNFSEMFVSNVGVQILLNRPILNDEREGNGDADKVLAETNIFIQETTSKNNKKNNKSRIRNKLKDKDYQNEERPEGEAALRCLRKRLEVRDHLEATEKFLEVLSSAVERRVARGRTPALCSQCSERSVEISVIASDILNSLNKAAEAVSNETERGFEEANIPTDSPHDCKCEKSCEHCKVGILFSGGIDSFIISMLAHRFVRKEEPIDLLNVSFFNADHTTPSLQAPDRLTGLQGFNKLSELFPERNWNFIEIDVSVKELEECRQTHIRRLIEPLNTVLDDSIGCALWFASRGKGRLRIGAVKEEVVQEYDSSAQIVLSGLGSDEFLAGYSRHRMRFGREQHFEGLNRELLADVQRLWSRNLGRDDRVVSCHGKEARFPFLDIDVASFLFDLPMNIKFDLTLPKGAGDKALLRQAMLLLGVEGVAVLVKRAIQFGSKIAKVEAKGQKGSDVCGALAH